MSFPPVTHPSSGVPEDGLPKRGEIFDGKYRIEGILGVGGMGVVFAARHLRLDERVAIKILLPQWAGDPSIVSRFMQEGRSSLKIRSEHVVRVLDDGVLDGQPYLVLEYLEGKDFDTLVAEEGPLPIATAVDSLLQACEALAEAHVAGVIHRDLKPANLFLIHRADGSPCVKVLDFGISKVILTKASGFQTQGTLPTMMMGSPHYMSPEQMESPKDVDERSDIWSLGAILHELLAGSPPFQAETITALYAQILRDPPPLLTLARADIPPGLEMIVLRCLEKDPAKRYANVAMFARALASFGSASAQASADRISRIIEGGIGPAPVEEDHAPTVAPVRAKERLDTDPSPPIRRPIAGYAALMAVMLALGSGIGWKVVQQSRAIHGAEVGRQESARPALAAEPTIPPIPPPVATSTLSTTSATTTTKAASAKTAAPTTTAATTPAPATSARPVAAPAPSPPHPHHVHHLRTASPPLPTFPVPSVPVSDNPYASPGGPATPSATPPAPPAPSASAAPADPNQLFDERK